jgi:hypothetical protein
MPTRETGSLATSIERRRRLSIWVEMRADGGSVANGDVIVVLKPRDREDSTNLSD